VTNVYAHTAPGGSYPQYVSVNDPGDDLLEIQIRGEPTLGAWPRDFPVPGSVARAILTHEQAVEMARAILGHVR
jgi:hypothetical protein